jgi:hypothetical protein
MAGWWDRVEKAIDFALGVADSRSPKADPQTGTTAEPRGGLIGSFETKMAGVLVSALREAFNRDAARLEAEREQADHERRRAELALQLEMTRQAAEREAARLKAVGTLAVIVWLASLLHVTVHPVGYGAARVILGAAWACLTGAIAAAFVAYGRVRDAAARLPSTPGGDMPASPPPSRFPAADAASWLAVGGLALAAISLLVSM